MPWDYYTWDKKSRRWRGFRGGLAKWNKYPGKKMRKLIKGKNLNVHRTEIVEARKK